MCRSTRQIVYICLKRVERNFLRLQCEIFYFLPENIFLFRSVVFFALSVGVCVGVSGVSGAYMYRPLDFCFLYSLFFFFLSFSFRVHIRAPRSRLNVKTLKTYM